MDAAEKEKGGGGEKGGMAEAAAAAADAAEWSNIVEKRSRFSSAMALVISGMISFLVAVYLVCTSSLGDEELEAAFRAEVRA